MSALAPTLPEVSSEGADGTDRAGTLQSPQHPGTVSSTARQAADLPASGARHDDSPPLNVQELRQLRVLRRVGTTGAILLAFGSVSSYGGANPVPNPMDGLRILGLLSRIGPASLAVAYAGIVLVVLAWLLLGRLATPSRDRRITRRQLTHTLAMWAAPFLVTPPLFSRDVYSYLAVGQMMRLGFNPYASGPYDVLGDGDTFAHQVDGKWQSTPTPYGPLFLLITRGIVTITGEHLIAAILLQRLFELLGIAALVWALPRIARRRGVDPIAALWLGALNPLVLFHLIAGGHNEALMVGMMMAGLVIALERSVELGTVVLTLAVGIKATAGLALAFLVVALALRAGGSWRSLFRVGVRVGAVFVATFGLLTVLSGVGVGWFAALNVPGLLRSYLSISTVVGVVTGWFGKVLGLGDHTDGVLDVLTPFGTVLGAALAAVLWWRCWRHGLDPILGLAVAIGGFVLLSPVVQPWYLLWAAVPLAASTTVSRYRKATIAVTAVLSIIVMPSGSVLPPLTIAFAGSGSALVLALFWWQLQRADLVPISERARWLHAASALSRLRHPSAGRQPGPPG